MTKKIDSKIKELEEKLEEATNNWKRALADYQNLEKRLTQEREILHVLLNAGLILKFLPILDNLEKAVLHIKDDGLSMVVKQFKEALVSEGVAEIEIKDGKFDPNFCEAVGIVQGKDEGKIAQVIEKGYQLKGKVIRAAKVRVFKKEVGQEEKKAEKA
jgi:molecular chaperone GrpE